MWSGPFCSAILQCLSLSLSDDSNHSYASRALFTYLSGGRRPAKRGMRSQAFLIHVIVFFFSLCVVYMVAAGKLSRARQSPRRLDFPVYLYGAGLQLTLVARCMVSFQQCR